MLNVITTLRASHAEYMPISRDGHDVFTDLPTHTKPLSTRQVHSQFRILEVALLLSDFLAGTGVGSAKHIGNVLYAP